MKAAAERPSTMAELAAEAERGRRSTRPKKAGAPGAAPKNARRRTVRGPARATSLCGATQPRDLVAGAAVGRPREGHRTRGATPLSLAAASTPCEGMLSWVLVALAPSAFNIAPTRHLGAPLPHVSRAAVLTCSADDEVIDGPTKALTAAEIEEVGNLVADDEWLGLGMELAIVFRSAVRESVKKNLRDFTGNDEYKIGDVSKEVDARVKGLVADYRNKEEYELGDLTLALDEMAKEEVKKLTGKDEYETGDLSIEIDKRVKASVADFCGKDEYAAGDLSREIDKRIKQRVNEFTGKEEYSFGDISVEIERRRVEWVQGYLGTSEYEFGDLTKKFVRDITGKDDYEFGDLTKTAVRNFTGKDEYKFGDISKAIGQKLFGNKDVKKKP